MNSRNFVSSVMNQKCPKCRQGNLFQSRSYDLKNFTKMNETCVRCQQPFELEPSFYYGAMYISYALTVALSVAVFVAMIVLWQFDIKWYLALNFSAMAILFPLIFRLSRSIWAHIFIRAEKKTA